MPGTHEFGEVTYTLSDLAVCAYNAATGANTGTPVALADGQMLEIEPEADNDQLRSYGQIVRLLSVTIGAKLNFSQGGVDIDAGAIMYGLRTQTSGTTPNQVRTVDVSAGGSGLPYFSVIGTSPSDDGGLMVLGIRVCKLDMVPKYSLNGKENKFNVGEASGYAVPPSAGGYLFRPKFYETASGFTMPTSAANFGAFFTSPA